MDPIIISVICLCLIFGATTLGSSLVFVCKKTYSARTGLMIVGLASGIMMATSFFGLLLPSIEESKSIYGEKLAVLPVVLGFILGGVLLYFLDKVVPHLHKDSEEAEGIKTDKINRRFKFILAVTLHNIPEGIAVGLLCGYAIGATDNIETACLGALSLAIGIAIQNLPEGSAVSIPLLEDGVSKPKAFLLGTLTGVVEPIFAFIAIFLAAFLNSALPYLLSFAAGAMMYVTIDELIPEIKCRREHSHFGLWAFMIGFAIMTCLEILL